jgi:hypothetical protein
LDILDPKTGDEILDAVYDQLADFMLQPFQMDFDCIGALSPKLGTKTSLVSSSESSLKPTDSSKSSSEKWEFKRPLTYAMNELVTLTGYPVDQFPSDMKHFTRVNRLL